MAKHSLIRGGVEVGAGSSLFFRLMVFCLPVVVQPSIMRCSYPPSVMEQLQTLCTIFTFCLFSVAQLMSQINFVPVKAEV